MDCFAALAMTYCHCETEDRVNPCETMYGYVWIASLRSQ